MAKAAARKNIIDESIDQIRETVDNVNSEFEKLQKRARKNVKQLETRYQRNAKKAQTRFNKLPAVKRVEKIRKDVRKQVDSNVDRFMSMLPVATDSDIKKINRKLNQINRKLKELENAKA